MQFQLELTEEQVNGILEALADQPFRKVAGLITQIQTQANAQVQAAQAPTESPAEPQTPAADAGKED